MFRIGIDFDNTIACYDQAFNDVASLLGLKSDDQPASKIDVKALVLEKVNGDLDWQRLQGQVYGKHMLLAKVFAGFHEFLYLSKLRGHEVFIVSHKSEFGHFDKEFVPLREQAILWLTNNMIFQQNEFALSKEHVFFESTREDKVRRIRHLACTHFIDDLPEVFEESLFPDNVQKIWFCPSGAGEKELAIPAVGSWRELTNKLHGSWSDSEVCHIVRATFPSLGVTKAEHRSGRGNSRVYKLTAEHEADYFLKIYPDLQIDFRRRLETEFAACQVLKGRAYHVAEAVAADEHLGWGIYNWIPGDPIETPDEQFLISATEFVQRLYCDSRSGDGFNQFNEASEACLSGSEITRQIQERLQKLQTVQSEELIKFLAQDLIPSVAATVQFAKHTCGQIFDAALNRSLQVPSPSDFGSHNALRDGAGSVTFIDFEYFGWDDPVKLVSDFYWHPGMNLSANLRKQWIFNSLTIFREDQTFARRLSAYLPLYGLRWCLIILNEFLKVGVARRSHVDVTKADMLTDIRSRQLSKAKLLLQTIKELTHDDGSAIQAT